MTETILLSTNVVECILRNNLDRAEKQIRYLDEKIVTCIQELQRLMEQKVVYAAQERDFNIALDKCQKQ